MNVYARLLTAVRLHPANHCSSFKRPFPIMMAHEDQDLPLRVSTFPTMHAQMFSLPSRRDGARHLTLTRSKAGYGQPAGAQAIAGTWSGTATVRSDQVFPKAIAGTFSSTRGGSSAALMQRGDPQGQPCRICAPLHTASQGGGPERRDRIWLDSSPRRHCNYTQNIHGRITGRVTGRNAKLC